MGRYLKDVSTAVGYALRLPAAGISGPAPSNLVDGLLRFNTDTDRVQFTKSGSWYDIAPVGKVTIRKQDEVGDGTQTDWFLDYTTEAVGFSDPDSIPGITVFIGGVYQEPGANYTIVDDSLAPSGKKISFTSPPPAPGVNPNKIVIIYNLNSTDAVLS